mgnify:CR=1 FL=1|tara:strand:- start:9028 stop:9501 length:474 start_codon:yes stop_codon:yes gene_type:complete
MKLEKSVKLGYRIDDNGNEVIGTSTISTRIKELDVKLLIHINKDVSYPLQSPHNKGFHVKVRGKDGKLISDFNVNDVTTESELIDAVIDFFNNKDKYVMITSAVSGETFQYETKVYNQTAIDNKSYDCWDEDLEDLEDNVDHIVTVFLNNELRWEVE